MGSKNKTKKIKRKKRQENPEDSIFESDETFAFVAGYTAGGAPYGITWEEMEAAEQRGDEIFGEERRYCNDEEIDLPFD